MSEMERIDGILQHSRFQEYVEANRVAEAQRRFCRHDMGHFLDVARIGRIINLEEGFGLSGEIIYAAALLHDIGRHVQYQDQTPHELASAALAPEILADCGFSQQEAEMILDAIRSHRNRSVAGEKNLRGLLYRADKASRACFACAAERDCDWKQGKKNMKILY